MLSKNSLNPCLVLVTGFDPFGGSRSNPSQWVVESLAQEADDRWRSVVLPTSYARAESRMEELLTSFSPQWILHLGLASQSKGLRLESTARNLDNSHARDNDGVCRRSSVIRPDGPSAYPSGLPLASMTRLAESAGLKIEKSENCGGFVCNHVFYCTSHLLAQAPAQTQRCGFVHLPKLAANSPELAATTAVIAAWLRAFTSAGFAES